MSIILAVIVFEKAINILYCSNDKIVIWIAALDLYMIIHTFCWCICEPMYRGPCIGSIYPTLLGFGGIHPLFPSYRTDDKHVVRRTCNYVSRLVYSCTNGFKASTSLLYAFIVRLLS